MAHLLFRIGRGSAARPWAVILGWIGALIVAVGSFFAFSGTLSDAFSVPGLESEAVADEVADELPDVSGSAARIVFSTDDGSEFTSEQQDAIAGVMSQIGEFDYVNDAVDPFETQATLDDQTAQIADGQSQIEEAWAQIEASQAELDAGQAQLDEARAEAEAGAAELAAGKQQLEESQAQIEAGIEQAQSAGAASQVAELQVQLAYVNQQLEALAPQEAQLEAGLAQLDESQAELDAGAQQLEDGIAELEAQEEQLGYAARLADAASGIQFVSDDGSTALASVTFTTNVFDLEAEEKDAIVTTVEDNPIDGVTANFSSELVLDVSSILGVGELIGLALAFIVLMVMMRTIWPAIQPVISSLIGVGIGVTTALAFSGIVEMASVTPVLGVMLGLAVGIDYSLFIVNRHRTQVRRGMDVKESVGVATGTAGNAVVFAGATVLIALLALNATLIPFLGIMGTVAAFCVAVAVLAAVTLTPALLGLMGTRVLPKKARATIGHEDHHEKPFTPMSTARAVLSLLVAVIALGVIALPALDMRLGLPSGAQDPVESTSYQAYTRAADAFGDGVNGTMLITARIDEGTTDEIEQLGIQAEIADTLMGHDNVAAVAPVGVNEDGDFYAFQLIPSEGPGSVETEQLVYDLRDSSPLSSDLDALDGAVLGVAGEASGNVDLSAKLADALPLYLALVVGLSLIILIVAFRSLLVPLAATAGFILSLFAAFGATTAVYQWGWLGALFDVHDPGPILNFMPVLLTGILFGLAMDYQLFLASGMREAYVHGASARQAVTAGLRHGWAVVTAAAIIMASIFGGFVFSEIATIRSIGFALAIGVLFDAFVVRMVIIPSLLHLAGDAAWWIPKWLDRILPNVDIEGAQLEREHPMPVENEGTVEVTEAAEDAAK